MKLATFNYSIIKLKLLYRLLFWCGVAWFGYEMYNVYLNNQPLFSKIIELKFMDDKNILGEILDLLIVIGKVIAVFVAMLIGYYIIRGLCKKIPLPTACIRNWESNKEITPAFAHRLISYFSYGTSISVYSFCNIYNHSQAEINTLAYNYSNPNLKMLFDRFDPDLVIEVKYAKTFYTGNVTTWSLLKSLFVKKEEQNVPAFMPNFSHMKPSQPEPVKTPEVNAESVENNTTNIANNQVQTNQNNNDDRVEPSLDEDLTSSPSEKPNH